MHPLILGLNHTTAPLAVREQVAFSPEQASDMVRAVLAELAGPQDGAVGEAAVLSTCNRTEFWLAAEDTKLAVASLLALLARRRPIDAIEFARHTYVHEGAQAARHAFRVASGLDSMVLGETQIVGQMHRAEKIAREASGLGLHINRLFQTTFTVAKEVRSSTEIGAHSVSMAAAAVRLALRLFGRLTGLNVLFVGAGEMIELCAAHFSAQSPASITVANRTVERAEGLASRFHARAMRLADVPESIARFDIIVSCTASSLPIIGLGMVQRAVKRRQHRPIFIVDLAVPRDVEAEVSELGDVYVYTVDDLAKVVQSGVNERRAAVAQAEVIIGNRTRDFDAWLRQRDAVPEIRALRERAEAIREAALADARRELAAGRDADDVLARLSRTITQKLVHDPVVALRGENAPTQADRDSVRRAVARFFFGRRH